MTGSIQLRDLAMPDTSTKVHIVVVHAIPGFTALPTPTVKLLSEDDASVLLTTKPDEVCIHVDRKNALASLAFTGGLSDDVFEERFASAMAETRSHRKQYARSHAWLVTDASVRAHLEHGTLRELPEFAISFDSISEETHEDLKRRADSVLSRVTAALSIILGEPKFPDIKRVAAGNYSLQPGNPRPTYELRFEFGSPTLSISSPADERLVATLTDYIGHLSGLSVDTAHALEETDDHLRSFIAAWAALEIFARKVFSANFNSKILSSLGLADSGWEGELYARLAQEGRQVSIRDCFAFLAVWLSRSSAKDDIDLFAQLNKARTDLYHEGVVAKHLPSRDAINLFRKYLALQLAGPEAALR